MKNKLLSFAMLVALSSSVPAKNTVTKISQVTASVVLTDDLDYVITGSEPFTVTGSINIKNKEHAVVILENIRPSAALSFLGFIDIDGVPAVDGENCQVKMYAQGAIIMPYAKDLKPLTVYSEQNFDGESVSDFGLENSGGFMNTLTEEKLNNRIRSFKLKRGYMVTFANNPGGRGYSRCFIADDADLEFAALPDVLDRHISSYRIFRWNDAQKKGLASDTGKGNNSMLNSSWCYTWGVGYDMGMDCECVPHHIHETYPSPTALGKATFSPHMKTNNEPANSHDDQPATVEQVLANWEELMATGMRLCSPSYHDGGTSWLRNFLNEIDKRGWRCDIVDLHCYWTESHFNDLQKWYNDFHRPIWISEFLWGSSWGKAGIFAVADNRDSYSVENQQKNYDGLKPILDKLNKWPYVERYSYWNHERNCSKLFSGGNLSIAGKYYAEMKPGIGYKKAYEYVPKVVYNAPEGFDVVYTERTQKLTIQWTNKNMELTDSTLLELSIDGGEWQTVRKYESSEKETYVYNEVFSDDFQKGTYTYRVHNYDMDGNERMTEEKSVSLVGAEGVPGLQYGMLRITDTEETNTTFDVGTTGESTVFMGLVSYNNPKVVPVGTVVSVAYDKFSFRAFPWNEGDYVQTVTEPETVDFMVFSKGRHQYGDVMMEVGETPKKVTDDSVWVSFETPFPDGVTPVVIANVVSRYKVHPYMVKVWNVTREGFAVKLSRQAALNGTLDTFAGQPLCYVAVTLGEAWIEDGNKKLTVGLNTVDKVDGRRSRLVNLLDGSGAAVSLLNPYFLCGPQTDNYPSASVYRIVERVKSPSETDASLLLTTGLKVIRQKDETSEVHIVDNAAANGDLMGWIAISENYGGTKVADVRKPEVKVWAEDGRIVVAGTENYNIYGLDGRHMSQEQRLPDGIYIVKTEGKAVKIMVSSVK